MQRYQALSTGAEPVESQLQEMLVEYLNAEITLQTVEDITQAVQVRDGGNSVAWHLHLCSQSPKICPMPAQHSALILLVCSAQWLKTTFLAVRVSAAA